VNDPEFKDRGIKVYFDIFEVIMSGREKENKNIYDQSGEDAAGSNASSIIDALDYTDASGKSENSILKETAEAVKVPDDVNDTGIDSSMENDIEFETLMEKSDEVALRASKAAEPAKAVDNASVSAPVHPDRTESAKEDLRLHAQAEKAYEDTDGSDELKTDEPEEDHADSEQKSPLLSESTEGSNFTTEDTFHDESVIINMNDVNLTYPNGTIALKHVSMQIRRGEFVFMVGSSGSGKSTLIKTLLGELRPTSGSIIVDKNDLGKITRKQLPYYRRKIGVVFQEFRLLEDRNVFENVELAQRVIGMNKTNRRENVKKVLKLVGLYGKRKSKVTELSGGEQQRVAIARAMVNKPLVLLADEPTGNLDPNNSWEIMKLLVELNKIGTTVLVVTHNDTMVNVMQQRVITLNKGVITNDEQGGYVQ
jgi:cell division transport system ATP-binding protein